MTKLFLSTGEKRGAMSAKSDSPIDNSTPSADATSQEAMLAVLTRPLPEGGERELVEISEKVGAGPAIYLSTPITTGRKFLEWLTDAAPVDLSSADYGRRLRTEVIEENRRALIPLKKQLAEAFPDSIVIDPTDLEVPDWIQQDYHRFWVEVLRRFAASVTAAVIFADGWEYSIGCCIEFATATSIGLPTFDSGLNPMSACVGSEMIRSASHKIEEAGLDSRPLISAACYAEVHAAR